MREMVFSEGGNLLIRQLTGILVNKLTRQLVNPLTNLPVNLSTC